MVLSVHREKGGEGERERGGRLRIARRFENKGYPRSSILNPRSLNHLPFALSIALFLTLAGVAASPLRAQPLERYAYSRAQMGTAFNIVLYAPDSVLAQRAADAAFARIDTLNEHLSDYLADSELSRLSATAGQGQAVPVSDDLWAVLMAAQRMAEQTGGAFDVTVGPLTRLWRWAMRRDRLPPEDRLAHARQAVGYRHLVLDSLAHTVSLKKLEMGLDLGGIAKGFAVDEALEVLQAFGLTRVLIDGGGDLRLGDPPPGAPGWRIEVSRVNADGERVQEERFLARKAVATSGATYRYVEVDGVRYSHLLDPRTGMGLTDERLVTVIAPTGMQADALASALSVLGPDDGLAFAAGLPEVAARFILGKAEGYHQRQSPTFEAFFVSSAGD